MPALLRQLGFEVNERSRRTCCILHKGANPGSFSWTEDGLWHCFACGRGGDKLSLIQTVHRCGFKDALKFLAALDGVDISTDAKLWRELAQRRRERKRLKCAARKLRLLERAVALQYRDEVHSLERLRQSAAKRILAIEHGEQERFRGEINFAWEALAFVVEQQPRTTGGYYVASFASEEERARFALRPAERKQMIDKIFETGLVTGDKGKIVELIL